MVTDSMGSFLSEDVGKPYNEDDSSVPCWYGTIAEDVTDFDDEAWIILSDLDVNYRFGPCLWPRRDNYAKPSQGDRCIVMTDNRGTPWIVGWWPATAAAPPSGGTWVSGTGAPANAFGSVGNFYLNTTNGNVYEKTGSITWTLRGNLTGGGGGGAAVTYIHTQSTLSATWVVPHGLGQYPSITVVDTGDSVIIPDVHYDNNNQVTLTFGSATTGKAYLN
jgi:hypothetical protein